MGRSSPGSERLLHCDIVNWRKFLSHVHLLRSTLTQHAGLVPILGRVVKRGGSPERLGGDTHTHGRCYKKEEGK